MLKKGQKPQDQPGHCYQGGGTHEGGGETAQGFNYMLCTFR